MDSRRHHRLTACAAVRNLKVNKPGKPGNDNAKAMSKRSDQKLGLGTLN